MVSNILIGPERAPPSAEANRRHAFIAALIGAGVLLVILALAVGDVAFLGGVLRYREDEEVRPLGGALLATWMATTVVVFATLISAGQVRAVALAAVLLLRATLILAIAFMFAFPFLPQLEGKSMLLRAAVFPVLLSALPAVYLWRARGASFPSVFDAAWSYTFVFDIVSNDLHWYGTWQAYDDFVHFVNGVLYLAALTVALRALELVGVVRLGFVGAVLGAFFIYGTIHLVWEMWEHYADVFLGTDLQPGGMAEASANSLASFAAVSLAVPLLLWWRRIRLLDEAVAAPLARVLQPRAILRSPEGRALPAEGPG